MRMVIILWMIIDLITQLCMYVLFGGVHQKNRKLCVMTKSVPRTPPPRPPFRIDSQNNSYHLTNCVSPMSSSRRDFYGWVFSYQSTTPEETGTIGTGCGVCGTHFCMIRGSGEGNQRLPRDEIFVTGSVINPRPRYNPRRRFCLPCTPHHPPEKEEEQQQRQSRGGDW